VENKEKVCPTCKQTKSIDNFGLHRSTKDGHRYQCKLCNASYDTDLRKAKDPEKERDRCNRKSKTYKQKHWPKVYAKTREWVLANPDKVRDNIERFKSKPTYDEDKKRQHLRYYYDLTLEEYNEMLEKQQYCCSICKSTTPSGRKDVTAFFVDHKHSTGFIRGLLCQKCNFGLGYFQDNIDLLREAIIYLQKANDREGELTEISDIFDNF
jgi:hypothetical protein